MLPTALPPRNDLGSKTRFEFPFNNSKKSLRMPSKKWKQASASLAETTLLFLSHLKTIHWRVDEDVSGKVLRTQHSENHVEVVRQNNGKAAGNSHFLKFDGTVKGLEKQRVAVAFALDFLPNVEVFDAAKPLAKQLRIIPANPGRVAVFFPAEKEISGLRFHLHAPFVPELSRASIKESTANQPLFQQLANLTASSLQRVRDLGLLTADFLSVLPNPQDSLSDRYGGIRNAIVEEMNEYSLTPTHARSHAPAKYLLQAKASLKDLLWENDLEFLMEHDEVPFQWAIGAAKKNGNADRFLCGLAITEWDIDDFVELLSEKTSDGFRSLPKSSSYAHGPDAKFMDWLSEKPLEWHQRLYSLLSAELSPSGGCRHLKGRSIVRLSNGEYSVGSNCFFPSDGVEHDDVLPRVDSGVYTAGKSKPQQLNAKKFLEEIGVREVGEAEQVEAILKQRYTRDNFKPKKQELKRFITLVETEPKRARLFADYFIFEGQDGKWHQPDGIFVDLPFMETGLSAYYDAIGGEAKRYALSESYHNCKISVESIAKFAELVGAQLAWKSRQRLARPIHNEHIFIPSRAIVIPPRSTATTSSPALENCLQIQRWRARSSSGELWYRCRLTPIIWRLAFEKSERWGARYADSQFVHHLRNAAWIPQRNGAFVRPAEASRVLLPEGFPFDQGWSWLKAIHFGQGAVIRSEAQQQKQALAATLGFADAESMDRASASPPCRSMNKGASSRNWKRHLNCLTTSQLTRHAVRSDWPHKPLTRLAHCRTTDDPSRSTGMPSSKKLGSTSFSSTPTLTGI